MSLSPAHHLLSLSAISLFQIFAYCFFFFSLSKRAEMHKSQAKNAHVQSNGSSSK